MGMSSCQHSCRSRIWSNINRPHDGRTSGQRGKKEQQIIIKLLGEISTDWFVFFWCDRTPWFLKFLQWINISSENSETPQLLPNNTLKIKFTLVASGFCHVYNASKFMPVKMWMHDNKTWPSCQEESGGVKFMPKFNGHKFENVDAF